MIFGQAYPEFLNFDYGDLPTLAGVSVTIFVIFLLRYFIVSWVYLLLFRKNRKPDDPRLLVKTPIGRNQRTREIRWAALSAIVFTIITILTIMGWQKGIIKLYLDVTAYPLWYLPVSLVLLLLLHECYYYWIHRWMHIPSVYRVVHRAHHESIDTSVYTAFSFHPLESLLQALFLPIALMIVPTYFYMFLFILIIMTISATINHAGVEIYPSNALGRWMGKWLVGSAHHHVHHKRFRYNYGLYFTFWDKWMKTESKDFDDEFLRVTGQKADSA